MSAAPESGHWPAWLFLTNSNLDDAYTTPFTKKITLPTLIEGIHRSDIYTE